MNQHTFINENIPSKDKKLKIQLFFVLVVSVFVLFFFFVMILTLILRGFNLLFNLCKRAERFKVLFLGYIEER